MPKFLPSPSRISSEYPQDRGDSSTSSLMAEDKAFLSDEDHHGQFMGLHRSSKGYSTKWKTWSVVMSLTFLIAGLSVWGHVIILLRSFRCDTTPKTDHFEADLLYSSRVVFQPHKYLGGAPSNATDEMWRRFSPPGDGIVEIPNELTGGLPASLPAPNNPDTAKVYGISMFHQLHCLNFLRFAYFPEGITDMEPEEIGFHRDHCLDYIRQGIMCMGDVSFEPLTNLGINGMGATHQCRDFDTLFSWAYDHRSDKMDGSGYKGGRITHTPGHRNDFGEDEDDSGVPHGHGHGH